MTRSGPPELPGSCSLVAARESVMKCQKCKESEEPRYARLDASGRETGGADEESKKSCQETEPN